MRYTFCNPCAIHNRVIRATSAAWLGIGISAFPEFTRFENSQHLRVLEHLQPGDGNCHSGLSERVLCSGKNIRRCYVKDVVTTIPLIRAILSICSFRLYRLNRTLTCRSGFRWSIGLYLHLIASGLGASTTLAVYGFRLVSEPSSCEARLLIGIGLSAISVPAIHPV